ncbi:MAG TPA: hypothetical protein VFN35_36345, partial [Ktedonobacteraceae bacterium]|nr:hypothetical protein [Ktedonobacteraceae bacterium]
MAKFPLEKIVAPGLPPTILRRTSLIASLAQAIGGDSSALGQETSWYKLILLCAPAGYGKTTVLADFARTNKMRCCWAHLEATEREMLTFLHLLLQSFRQTFPDFGSLLDGQLSAMLSRQRDNLDNGGHAEQFVDSLVAAIDSEIKENFALVLCDYHEVNERIEINRLMNHLLSKLPAVCTVVIESRSIPKLNFVPLLARRQIAGFGTEHLCFTAKDICDLTQLLHTAPLSLDEAEQMRQIYGGWIVGILLGTHLGRALLFPAKESQPIASDLMLPSEQNRSYLFAYLVSEVFAREQDVYTFLRELSLFSQLDPELCNIFLSITDAEKRLEHIEQQGLFVTHTTVEGRKIYTCHPVLRELMVKDLKEKDHALFKSLHDRAARLFYTLHDYHKAIPHAVEGEAYDLGVDLILECARPILRKGYSEILISWLDLLPTNVQERYPALLLMHARLCLMKYKLEDAHIFIEKALAALARLPQNETATIRSEALIIKSAALFQAGDYLATKQLCEQALAMLSLDERELRARAYQRLGACHCLLGQSITGVAYLQQALQLWGHDTEARQTALLHMYLANAYSNLGNYALAEHHRLRAIHGFDYINDIWGKIHGLIGLGATKRLWGMLSEAEKIIQQALDLARSTAFLSGQAYALLNLGEIYQDQSNYAQSLAMIEEGLEIAQGLQDKYLLNCTFCTLALTYLFMGDASSALFLISDSTLYSAPDTSYEGALLRLTRSIIFFQQRLYQQAEEILEPLNRALETTELKLLSIRVSLYLAACRLAQNKREQIQSLFAQVA